MTLGKATYMLMFNQLMSVNAVPETWTTALITPVFKKDAAGLVSIYRPISLTSVPSKIFERINLEQNS